MKRLLVVDAANSFLPAGAAARRLRWDASLSLDGPPARLRSPALAANGVAARVGTNFRPRPLVLALAGVFLGCGGADSDDPSACTSPEVLPHLSPVTLPDMLELPDGIDADAGTAKHAPYEWVLLLQSGCEQPVEISEICIVGDKHNGKDNSQAFTIEGPVPASVPFGTESAIRVTYNPDSLNIDADGDDVPEPDRVAIVVQSNAANFPTLIVPLCARMVAPDSDYPEYECTSPVSLSPGAVDLTLCGAD